MLATFSILPSPKVSLGDHVHGTLINLECRSQKLLRRYVALLLGAHRDCSHGSLAL
jgi:hypothetical protein